MPMVHEPHSVKRMRTGIERLRIVLVALCAFAAALLYWREADADPPAVKPIVKPTPRTQAVQPTRGIATHTPSWVAAARTQIGVTRFYDPAYVHLPYPDGDVPKDRGVCTDVIIRALRPHGLDLQQRVHEDMRAHFAKYPQKWGLRRPDSNIDHRRVPNLQTWFARQGWSLPVTQQARDYRAGDLVTWMLPGNLPHIGIVSDRAGRDGRPLIVHNIGRGTREEDILFSYPITGHYRPRLQ